MNAAQNAIAKAQKTTMTLAVKEQTPATQAKVAETAALEAAMNSQLLNQILPNLQQVRAQRRITIEKTTKAEISLLKKL